MADDRVGTGKRRHRRWRKGSSAMKRSTGIVRSALAQIERDVTVANVNCVFRV